MPLVKAADSRKPGDDAHLLDYGKEMEGRLARIEAALREDPVFSARYPLRWLAV
jgi:hypothetical protein